MTVAAASAAYETARTAYLRAAADLRVALGQEVARLADVLPRELFTVAEAVAAEFEIELADLLGRSRRREHAEPRFALLAIAHQHHPAYSKHALATCFCRDHAMVDHSIKAVRRLCDIDPLYRARVARVRAAILERTGPVATSP